MAITEFEEVIETLKDIELTCGDITIGDISTLIDYLFITGPSLGLPDCL